MTNRQIDVFNELIADPNFKGAKQLKHLLWLNTTLPKYSIGDCFIVTDYGHRVFGIPVVNFKACIKKISVYNGANAYHYQLEMICEFNGKRITSLAFANESELLKRCDDNVNILDNN